MATTNKRKYEMTRVCARAFELIRAITHVRERFIIALYTLEGDTGY